jgi:hypothetical protein
MVLANCDKHEEAPIINKFFLKKDGNIYYREFNPASQNKIVLLEQANPEHFRILYDSTQNMPKKNSPLAADCMNVYYRNTILTGANPLKFKVLSNGFSKDDQRVYFKNKNISGANPSQFEILGNYYAKDSNQLWFGNTPVKTPTHLSSFRIIDGYFSKDKDRVYLNNKDQLAVLKNTDPHEFIKEENKHLNKDSFSVYKNSQKVFIINKLLSIDNPDFLTELTADPESFSIIKTNFFKDKTGLFYKDTRIQGVQDSSFRILNAYYAKDAERVYYKGKPIEKADSKTFVLTPADSTDAADENYVFNKGKVFDKHKNN